VRACVHVYVKKRVRACMVYMRAYMHKCVRFKYRH